MTDEPIERGAAEEASDAPLTETEERAAERPASDPDAGTRPSGADAVGVEQDPGGDITSSE